ncbi:hypothetical protein C8Q79DRAFT_1007159 [Trametes meyenii]|nr:hypothetical protein C8Q79DRAFT_1007159 [Trametes meyenii]
MGINKDNVMDVAVKSLRVAKMVVGLVPASVPLLGPAIDTALNIAEFAEEVTDSRDKCRVLATRAVQFTHGIYERLNDPASTVDVTSTATHVATLLCALQDIESLMKRRAKMSWTKVLLRKDKLKKEAEELNVQLDDAFRLFTAQSAIATEQALVQSNAMQGQLLRHAEDAEHVSAELLNRTGQLVRLMQSVSISTSEGGMALFWKEELDFERDINSDSPGKHCAARWQASIRKTGQVVFVKTYRRQDDAFWAVIERSKQMMHPHIMQILGYSRQNSEHAFMVLEAGAGHQPFAKYAQNLHGVEKYTWTVDLTKQLQSAFEYMAELGLAKGSTSDFQYPYSGEDGTDIFGNHVVMDARNLFVGPGGTVRWDVYEWKYDLVPTMVDFGEGTIEITEREEAIKALTLAKLERHLKSPRPIERAAALLILWDRLMEFVDFDRDDEQNFAIEEELPWVGSCIQTLSFLPFTPEGRPVDFEDDTIDWNRTFGVPHFLDFDEEEDDMEYAMGPPDHIYIQQAGHWGVDEEADTFSGPSYIADMDTEGDADDTEDMEDIIEDAEDAEDAEDMVDVEDTVYTTVTENMEDEKWRRHTVIDMDYGVLFRTLQKIEETTKCRSFFLTQAVDLDIPRYIDEEDDEHGPISVVNALHFITTSYLVSLGPNPVGRPPKRMYFYERLHDEQSDKDLDTPWGYWSASPTPINTFPRGSHHPEEHRAYRQRPEFEVTYLGFSDRSKFVWQQCVEGFVFRTEVIVVVSSYRPTADERLLLHELHKCLVQASQNNRRISEQVRTSVRRKRAELEDADEHGHSARRQRIE